MVVRDCPNIMELSFEDGEYNMKLKKLSYLNRLNKKEDIKLDKSDFHNDNNELKNNYSKVPSQIETMFNELNTSLLNYINNKEQVNKW
jgi:hypothetical protein